MKLQRSGYIAGIALTATLALTGCGSDNDPATSAGDTSAAAANCAAGSLTAQGSTAQKNAMDEWIKAYQAQCSGAQINYQGTGSGAGIEAFIGGTADFAGSDSALKEDEQPKANAKCAGGEALNLPMVIGPIAVVYNVDGVDDLQLDAPTLAKIYSGKITKWNDAAIAAQNTGAKLPDTAIQAVHRSGESGTTDNFTKYLSKSAEADWTYSNAKAWKAPGGVAATGSDGVAAKVKSTAGTIAYVELSFAENSDLKMAKIKNGAGEYTALTGESAGKTIAGAKITGTGNNLSMSIDYNTTEAGAYPIVLVTYEIACSKGSPKAKEIQGFLKYTSSTGGQQALADLGYAPLPETIRSKVETAVASIS
ncbi:phosphate-binding protein PstS [Paractinoplanes deccanensis]|uniref:Phosphate-binding protein n=1 Tax=Paractinoplanes deccanensis TaxID=113561 RepID=A0ABQ3YD74_9ACTN|nr:phosphate ABC transporter substrate-binding protein PstS [Actinoplanes deccanensis]GID77959.1 phosphate-binding protein PstS [Actinoplanes deccanensis]